jgi:hypothetical protein
MTYQRIATATVGVTASTITFSAIPATFTDLLLIVSVRTSNGGNGDYSLNFAVNGSPNMNRRTIVSGAGQTPIMENIGGTTLAVGTTAQSGNSAIFSSTSIRIMDYTSSITKMALVEDGLHYFSNGLSNFSGLSIQNTAPITSITLSDAAMTNFIQNSTATLYGILKGGSGATISTT